MSRLTFDSFGQMIRNGVMLDGHPAGVQTFLYFWVKLGGWSASWIKTPFLLAGSLSVYLVFLIGKQWFDKITGLYTAAVLAGLQLFVMYSQIARPYISGLFFILWMVYHWSEYLFGRQRNRDYWLYILAALLAAYNHHFSLLMMGIVVLSGFWIIPTRLVRRYLVSMVIIFIAYLPHTYILYVQLVHVASEGLGGWLSPPGWDHFFQFLYWLGNTSFLIWILVIAVVLIGRHHKFSFRATLLMKKRVLLLTWFLVPYLIGVLYSVLVTPVLQYSVLIFSTPYLFLYLFSLHGDPKSWLSKIMILSLLLATAFTLIFQRHYYRNFSKQPMQQLMQMAMEFRTDSLWIIDNSIPFFHEYYFKQYKQEFPYTTIRNSGMDLSTISDSISHLPASKVIVSGLSGLQLQIVKHYFPYEQVYSTGFTHEVYVFSSCPSDDLTSNWKLIASDKGPGQLTANIELLSTEGESRKEVYRFDGNHEWGYHLSFDVDTMNVMPSDQFYVETDVHIDGDPGQALVFFSVKKGDENLYWNGSPLADLYIEGVDKYCVFLHADLSHVLSEIDGGKLNVMVGFWNKSSSADICIEGMRVFKHPGNPEKYQLLYP